MCQPPPETFTAVTHIQVTVPIGVELPSHCFLRATKTQAVIEQIAKRITQDKVGITILKTGCLNHRITNLYYELPKEIPDAMAGEYEDNGFILQYEKPITLPVGNKVLPSIQYANEMLIQNAGDFSDDACDEYRHTIESLLEALDARAPEASVKHEVSTGKFKNIYIDIPNPDTIGEEDNSWKNVEICKTKKEALAWIRENIGPCDDEGRIGLITYGEREEVSTGNSDEIIPHCTRCGTQETMHEGDTLCETCDEIVNPSGDPDEADEQEKEELVAATASGERVILSSDDAVEFDSDEDTLIEVLAVNYDFGRITFHVDSNGNYEYHGLNNTDTSAYLCRQFEWGMLPYGTLVKEFANRIGPALTVQAAMIDEAYAHKKLDQLKEHMILEGSANLVAKQIAMKMYSDFQSFRPPYTQE